MAVGLVAPERLLPVPGIRLSAVAAGIRYKNRNDLVLIEMAAGGAAAAVFTRNAFCAAPVHVAKAHIAATTPRLLLINSGNANAGTGKQGMGDAQRSCVLAGSALGVEDREVLPFSTGVIGEPLNVTAIEKALPGAVAALSEDAWMNAARAIMTTDTLPKGVSAQVCLSGGTVTLTGICKGAGMIRPDMATMLGYIATDAVIDKADLKALLVDAVNLSFNSVTVDGDTSTNDALVLLASGASRVGLSGDGDRRLFADALNALAMELAQTIIRDGEGATKFITLDVRGAAHRDEARAVAYTIAHSPLVKTAFFASDPNWGRILAAVGRAGIDDMQIEAVQVWLDDVQIVVDGGRNPEYREELGQTVMNRAEITVRVELGRGDQRATIWTTDLSHDYVKINAEYRT
ncbi:MAG: bifunctional glutamate N-acetyltransferase/amino-acid acetyltransferase ArgJ [Gammaproteobacteria bacterium]|nr:bifunctional glutamate N-acetyltransferase/amino-acid acetyltransferase ArgJ [Gammaproteobacteria bacterium]MCP5137225.1 bifunctional glutamate N-acetyltransferase/amino-acid acetyltransferase ArgJ [Gammaproteobacteria bacterium]